MPNQEWIFVVDTEQYAGNFERGMCAFMTGMLGECGVGSEEARLYYEQTGLAEEDFDWNGVNVEYCSNFGRTMGKIIITVILLGLLGCGDLSPKDNPKQEKKSIFHQKTREILNVAEAANFIVIEINVEANNLISAVLQTYEKQAPFLGTLGIKQWINAHKALNDRWPTYAELQGMMKKNSNITLPMMPYNRKYGYDEKIGEIVILEPKSETL